MSDKPTHSQSGGVYNTGTMNTGGGAVVGGNMTVAAASPAAMEDALRPLADALKAAPPEKRAQVEEALTALRQETAKGQGADDRVVAKIVDGLAKLVPEAVGAVVSSFASPILGALVGPFTSFVLENLRGE